MPTQYDYYEALVEGRWQPEILHNKTEIKGETEFVASYKQGNKIIERKSPWSISQAEGDLLEELKRGTLEGDYFPDRN